MTARVENRSRRRHARYFQADPLQLKQRVDLLNNNNQYKRMNNTSTKPRTSTTKEPTPVSAGVGQRKPSGGLKTQEPAGSNEPHHAHQVKQSSFESDIIEGQRDRSANNGAVTGRARPAKHL